MDIEQAAKTIQWLDEERRKDKKELAALQERLNAFQQEATAQARRIQELEAGLAATTTLGARFAKLEELIVQVRTEAGRQIEAVEQRRAESDREQEKARTIDREATNKLLSELRSIIEPVPAKLDQEIQARKEEDARVSRIVVEVQQKVVEVDKHEEDRSRTMAALEEGRRHENKRIAELQVEVGEWRRRQEEVRGRGEVMEDLVRRNDSRISEVAASEAERRGQQVSWMEQQAMLAAERDRRWNEWEGRFTTLQTQAEDFSRRMETYAETFRSIRKVREELEATVERLERRIGEMGELQRLSEDRLRQDWVAFQADDQKRWTTHMLLRDEQWREHDRLEQKTSDRLAAAEEQMAEAQDQLRVLQESQVSRLGGLMALVREWMAEYEQPFSKVK